MSLTLFIIGLRRCWISWCGSHAADEDAQLLDEERDAAVAKKDRDDIDPESERLKGLLMCTDTALGLSYSQATPVTLWEPPNSTKKKNPESKKPATSTRTANGSVAHEGPDPLLLEWEKEAAFARPVRRGNDEEEDYVF